jgi:lysophospholipase L1-like esterase
MIKSIRIGSIYWMALLMGLGFGTVTAKAQTNKPALPFANEIQAFVRKDRTNPPPKGEILFVGSSTIRKWKTLAEDFPGKETINRGFGGSQISDSIEYADKIILPYKPKIIVFYAGDNDLAAGKSVERVVENYRILVAKIHDRLPNTFIDFISIKPCNARWRLKDKVVAANEQIKAIKGDRLAFLDIYPAMLGEDGKPMKDLLEKDGLHPSRKCYALWATIINPVLDEQLAELNKGK